MSRFMQVYEPINEGLLQTIGSNIKEIFTKIIEALKKIKKWIMDLIRNQLAKLKNIINNVSNNSDKKIDVEVKVTESLELQTVCEDDVDYGYKDFDRVRYDFITYKRMINKILLEIVNAMQNNKGIEEINDTYLDDLKSYFDKYEKIITAYEQNEPFQMVRIFSLGDARSYIKEWEKNLNECNKNIEEAENELKQYMSSPFFKNDSNNYNAGDINYYNRRYAKFINLQIRYFNKRCERIQHNITRMARTVKAFS